jgi:hypothetical protein
MAINSQEFRAKALVCERHAKEIADAGVRQQWEELAMNWHLMANQVARYEAVISGSPNEAAMTEGLSCRSRLPQVPLGADFSASSAKRSHRSASA